MYTRNPFDADVFQTVVSNTASPGAGNNCIITLPANARSQLLAIGFLFIADANAADRTFQISYTRAGFSQTFASSYLPQTANLSLFWVCAEGLVNQPAVATGRGTIALPPFPALYSGDVLGVYCTGIQVGDTFVSIVHTFKVWPTP